MSDLLKPDGTAVIDVREMGKLSLATKKDIMSADNNKHDRNEYIYEKYHIIYGKTMTKQELLEHSKHEFFDLMVKSCNHGNVIREKHNADI